MEIGTWFGVKWVRRTMFNRSGAAKRRYRRKRLAMSAWGRKSARRKRRVR